MSPVRRCLVCVSVLSNSRQRYCSAACKQAAYRVRKDTPMIMGVAPNTLGEMGCEQGEQANVTSSGVTHSDVSPNIVTAEAAVAALYHSLNWALRDHLNADGTLEGFAKVMKRVAKAQGVDVSYVVLPRLNRAQRSARNWQFRHDEMQKAEQVPTFRSSYPL